MFEFFWVFFCVLDTRFVLSLLLLHTGCRSKHSGLLLLTGLVSTCTFGQLLNIPHHDQEEGTRGRVRGASYLARTWRAGAGSSEVRSGDQEREGERPR